MGITTMALNATLFLICSKNTVADGGDVPLAIGLGLGLGIPLLCCMGACLYSVISGHKQPVKLYAKTISV
jgi:hypothetical protein